MYDEYNVYVKNSTWILVLRPPSANMVRFMWLSRHKFHVDGTLSRYKARLVAKGSSQQLGVNFDETFSPVVNLATIRTVLSHVVSHKWPIHQLNVKNAFLNSDLSETVYMHQPSSFVDSWHPNHVVIYRDPYMDWNKHLMLDFSGLQWKYALQLLERAHMVNCNPSQTPVEMESKLAHLSCSSVEAEYRGVAKVVAETTWLRNPLHELHSPLSTSTLIYCENVSSIYMSAKPVQHQWMKHIEIDIISFVKWLLLVMLEFYMCPLVISMSMSSPRDYLLHYLKNFDPVCAPPPPAPTAGAY
nr:ribonuclease H-like domain-containing protein [Tanacetum cinerariifolium]GEX87826.1 ribonuclease H-like domain-containing protein [Tanacetum cinerariifolium]